MKISIIAAISQNRGLGLNNKLLFNISKDLKRFKNITENHVVIMGRKTFESMGKALPHRINIVVTKNKAYQAKNVLVANSLDRALKIAKEKKEKEVFIIGGASLYQQTIKKADKLYLTLVEKSLQADTFFPDYSQFKKMVFQQRNKSQGYQYTFLELEKE